jgi:hypothetical protein
LLLLLLLLAVHSGVLLPEELNWLMSQPHKQLALGQALSSIVAAAHIDPITRTQMDSVITKWTFTFGAFGRIYNTAIPSAYTRWAPAIPAV